MSSITGASLTGFTVKTKFVLLLPPFESETVRVIVAVPLALLFGVIPKVQSGAVPEKLISFEEIRFALLEVAPIELEQSNVLSRSVIVTGIWVMLVSSFVLWSETIDMVGKSLTGLTVKINVSDAFRPVLSVTVMVIFVVPLA